MRLLAIMLVAAALATSCNENKTTSNTSAAAVAAPAPAAVSANVPHGLDAAKVARGADIYKANCAVCHGAKAEGAPNWAKKGADGKYPPPPLDAQGHAWHHPMTMLAMTVKEGTVKAGGGMPAWTGILKDEDIEAVLTYVQSLWPAETYASWKLMDDKARAGLMHHH